MSVCAFNSLAKGKHSNLFIVAAFSNKSFSSKISLSVKNSYLLTLPKLLTSNLCCKLRAI